VCECIFKAKEEEEELWKLKYFTNAKTKSSKKSYIKKKKPKSFKILL
jgi:hypothetical protein